jgi:PRC-barrel domain protein
MQSTTTLENRETASLIGSDKVEGTAVYGADSQRIGDIKRVMIDKISGKVAYAVLSFGGFLGIGEDYYPEIRHKPCWLCHRPDPAPARGSTEV